MKSDTVGTIRRVVRVLRCLAEAPGEISISELSALLELAPSTVHRLLHMLIEEGIVARSDKRPLYGPGIEFFRLAALIGQKTNLADIAEPYMRAVVDEADEACMLTQPLPHEHKVMVSASIASSHPLRYEISMFEGTSLLRGATGRAILAFLDKEQVDAAIAVEEGEPDRAGPVDRAVLFAELADIRAKGYTITHGQKIAGAVGIGAPVFGSDGKVLAALCVTLPEQRFDAERGESIAQLVQAHAAKISAAMGYLPSR